MKPAQAAKAVSTWVSLRLFSALPPPHSSGPPVGTLCKARHNTGRPHFRCKRTKNKCPVEGWVSIWSEHKPKSLTADASTARAQRLERHHLACPPAIVGSSCPKSPPPARRAHFRTTPAFHKLHATTHRPPYPDLLTRPAEDNKLATVVAFYADKHGAVLSYTPTEAHQTVPPPRTLAVDKRMLPTVPCKMCIAGCKAASLQREVARGTLASASFCQTGQQPSITLGRHSLLPTRHRRRHHLRAPLRTHATTSQQHLRPPTITDPSHPPTPTSHATSWSLPHS